MAGRLPWNGARRRPFPASGIITVVGLVCALLGAVLIHHQGQSATQFTHALPAWRQLTADDVRSEQGTSEANFIGRFTTDPVEEGQTISLDSLGPPLPAGALADHDIVVLPALNRISRVLQSGDLVSIRTFGGKSSVCPVRILSVDNLKNGASRVVAAVLSAQIPPLMTTKDDSNLVAVRVWGFAEGLPQPSITDLCD